MISKIEDRINSLKDKLKFYEEKGLQAQSVINEMAEAHRNTVAVIEELVSLTEELE